MLQCKHQPVDDAKPDRLPQTRLAVKGESLGLNVNEEDNYY